MEVKRPVVKLHLLYLLVERFGRMYDVPKLLAKVKVEHNEKSVLRLIIFPSLFKSLEQDRLMKGRRSLSDLMSQKNKKKHFGFSLPSS